MIKIPVVPTYYKSSDTIYERMMKCKTQKASGIFYLISKSSQINANFGWIVPKHFKFDAGTKFSDSSFNYPVFARPCPTVPRHGFVDSIVCKNAEELNMLSGETYDVESDAEILITKPVDALYNAIITDGVVTFAGGNDGATSGKGVKYFYLLSDNSIADSISLDPSLLLDGELPFYEFVFDKENNTYLVQVRSAPGVPKSKNYIPAPVTVGNIIKAEGDLLKWESLLKKVDPTTTIIDHTDGSLASHYAIHAIVNKIPIFTVDLPNIGDYIEPTVLSSEITDQQKDAFYKAFCAGFDYSTNVKFGSSSGYVPESKYSEDVVKLALSCLHNYGAAAISGDYEVLGMCLGLFTRTGFAVSAGEARFAAKKSLNSNDDPLGIKAKKFVGSLSGGRWDVYRKIYKMKASELLEISDAIYYTFTKYNWGGGYGGPAWSRCTKSTIDLYNACIEKKIDKVVELFNAVIHEEHNNGKYLNKIISPSDFDYAASDPSVYALKNIYTIVSYMSNAWSSFDKKSDALNLNPIAIEFTSKSKYTAAAPNILNAPLDLSENKVNVIVNKVDYSNMIHSGASTKISDFNPVSLSIGTVTSIKINKSHDKVIVKYQDIKDYSHKVSEIPYNKIAALPGDFLKFGKSSDCDIDGCCMHYKDSEVTVYDSKGWFVISYEGINIKLFSKSALTKYIKKENELV